MASKPDTIKISVSQREDVFADRVDLHVTVKGASVFSGDQALKKAKEVNQLVAALTSSGLSPEAIHLQGVQIETASGTLLKSSSATYRLKIHCEKLEQLAELLDIIAAQKNAALERLEWKYPDEAARARNLETALQNAKLKATLVAQSLGVTLLGVYDFTENIYDEDSPYPHFAEQGMAKRSLGMVAAEPSLSMDIQHSKTIHVGVEIWYRVSSF